MSRIVDLLWRRHRRLTDNDIDRAAEERELVRRQALVVEAVAADADAIKKRNHMAANIRAALVGGPPL